MAAKKAKVTKKKKIEEKPMKKENKKYDFSYLKDFSFWTKNSTLIKVALVLVAVYVVIAYKGLVVAATVNGRPISRISIVKELEAGSGKSVLDQMINETLIRQKAETAHVEVTDEDIASAITDIEQNVLGEGQSIDDVLALQGMTREDLEEQIEIQVIVEKLLEGDAVVTDEELNEFVEANKESITEDNTEEDLRNFAREQLKQQKLAQRYGTWIQELREEANINYFVEY